MKANQALSPTRVTRLGILDTEDQVRHAVASATLEGLRPSQQSIDLVRAFAAGDMTGEDVLNSLRSYYGRHA